MLSILLILFAVLLVIGTPLAFAFGAASFAYISISGSISPILIIQKLFVGFDSFTFMAIPLFLLSGMIMNETNITKRLVDLADSLVGQFHGGLAQTTALSGMLMAGISGSANADASAIGALMLPPLREAGYDEGFRVSLVSACSVLGPIIPPSILMIVYAGVTTISVGHLFLAGIAPGIILGLSYMIYSYFYAKKNNIPTRSFQGWGHVWHCFVRALGGLVMPLIIIGGILAGIVTATEAGVLAIIYGLLYAMVTKSLTLKALKLCIYSSLRATVASVLVISFANTVGYIVTYENLPATVLKFMHLLTANEHVFLMIMTVFIVFLGMFIDSNAIILMMVPVFAPIALNYGINPLHFAIVFILAVATGGLTPPVGLVLYIVAGIENSNIAACCRAIWPFVFMMVFVAVVIIFVPGIALFIPMTL
jgi:C4-dicarboxylate transporter DctM subunit